MALKHKPEPLPILIQGSSLAEHARQYLIIGAVVLAITLGTTWWYQVPLSFNADTPLILLTVAGTPFGLVFLARGTWAWLRNRKSGGARFEYRPPNYGGTLTGLVRLNHMPEPLPDFAVTLLCRTSKYDDSTDNSSSRGLGVTWEKHVVVKAESVRATKGIAISIGLPPRNHAGRYNARKWVLQIRAPLPGLDFYQEFEPRLKPD